MTKFNNKGFTTIELAIVLASVVFIAALVGWGMNISKLIDADFEAPYKTEFVRTIGLVPVVGAVTGYMTIGEENANSK